MYFTQLKYKLWQALLRSLLLAQIATFLQFYHGEKWEYPEKTPLSGLVTKNISCDYTGDQTQAVMVEGQSIYLWVSHTANIWQNYIMFPFILMREDSHQIKVCKIIALFTIFTTTTVIGCHNLPTTTQHNNNISCFSHFAFFFFFFFGGGCLPNTRKGMIKVELNDFQNSQ